MLERALRLQVQVSQRQGRLVLRRTVFVARKIAVEVISGRLCVELLTNARDVLFSESRSC